MAITIGLTRVHFCSGLRRKIGFTTTINPSNLWSSFNQKYGSKGKQIDAILSDLIKFMYGTTNNVLTLINAVETAYRDLA